MSEFDRLEFAEVEVASTLALQVPGQCGCDPKEIGAAMHKTFAELGQLIEKHALSPAGPPRAIYTSYGAEGIQYIVAMPITAAPVDSMEDAARLIGTLPGGKMLRFTHRGPYAGLKDTYGLVTKFMKAKGLMASEADWARYMPMWEEYVNDPHTTPGAELVTHIYLPVP